MLQDKCTVCENVKTFTTYEIQVNIFTKHMNLNHLIYKNSKWQGSHKRMSHLLNHYLCKWFEAAVNYSKYQVHTIRKYCRHWSTENIFCFQNNFKEYHVLQGLSMYTQFNQKELLALVSILKYKPKTSQQQYYVNTSQNTALFSLIY